MTAVLLDTNVLVYAFDMAESTKRLHAMKIILGLQTNSLGCLSTQCISEFFNAAIRGISPKLSIEEAIQAVQDYLLAFPTFPLTQSIVLEAARAVRDHSISFYDAQIWASALINEVPLVFSEDFQDGRVIEGVRFVNPFAETFELEKWI